ncbi:hypothetical protein CAPTEDRAFT_153186 [Capitella teleta]|uniref:DNA polymerase n=1 Tax=Capitella teleta TaxID=283909 RepID=R7UZH6_CAPTE|nr:hypothetical protein CAPTEDRAFT_153186 [Capitella teleta]|eukprot:ELU09367.1 hypothetical protein CAPTEDRAFT_153186 [Capitella teleta]
MFIRSGFPDLHVTYVPTEEQLIDELIQLVRKWDPDILVGFEIQKASWGFIIKRACHLNLNLIKLLSRLHEDNPVSENKQADADDLEAEAISDIKISGRIVINLWRVLRHELTLNVYTFENVVFHALHKRVPRYSFRCLSDWYDNKTDLHRWRVIEYYTIRSSDCIAIMKHLDLISTTSEFARVFGIEFYHVLSRGSQYRVESMMLRIAKPLNYIPVSPSPQQRAAQRAPECIPLTMEPVSRFYTHPVVVLDFQSLYPSIMIAYNYCFTSCLGRLDCLAKAGYGPFNFGCSSLNIPPSVLKSLEKDVNICPNGVVFANQSVRKGVLPLMVEEILNTRLMVKKSMKDCKDDKTLQKMLHARQLGLKLIANVTFGYTAASFSGRMPLVEVGDSIVRKARETLERAIALVEDTPRWQAKVVYGDTDSMFLQLEGRTKEEAFKIGQEIADAVTQANPKPIKLKFEKVYLPCVLQAKKRYVGFMYETVDQKEPVFHAKGIETVRRDNCSVVSKMLERSIKLLFSTRDISQVKSYVQKQCVKMMEGRFNIQDCVFAKEFRGMSGYRGVSVPSLEIARKRLLKDRCAEPLVSERVPYVIVYGTPGLPLIQLVREPHELLEDPTLRINTLYYITKQVLPPLDRLFALIGVDVKMWYYELPRFLRAPIIPDSTAVNKKETISQYFSSLYCPICDGTTNHGTCDKCSTDPQRATVILGTRIRIYESKLRSLSQICTNCMGTNDVDLPCRSIDCPVLFQVVKAKQESKLVPQLENLLEKY